MGMFKEMLRDWNHHMAISNQSNWQNKCNKAYTSSIEFCYWNILKPLANQISAYLIGFKKNGSPKKHRYWVFECHRSGSESLDGSHLQPGSNTLHEWSTVIYSDLQFRGRDWSAAHPSWVPPPHKKVRGWSGIIHQRCSCWWVARKGESLKCPAGCPWVCTYML